MQTVPTPRLSLDDAQALLNTAEDALRGWHARQTTDQTRTYVRDGHEAVAFVEDLLRELHRVRAALVGEIRADELDRAARVDVLLAELAAGRRDVYPRDVPAGGALPEDVGGWPAGRAAGTSEGSQG